MAFAKINQLVLLRRCARHVFRATIMATTAKNATNNTTRCYCYFKNDAPHCPLAANEKDLDSLHLFNGFIEPVGFVDIDNAFVCNEPRKDSCKYCPFK